MIWYNQPAIGEKIQRRFGRFHLDGTQSVFPEIPDLLQFFVTGLKILEPPRQIARPVPDFSPRQE